MSHLRALTRLPAMLLSTGVLFGLWLLSRPLGLINRAWSRHAHVVLIRAWARSLTSILNVDITVRGMSPPPPFFLVSNHLSYLDIITFLSVVDGFFVAKSELASWPILGFLARATGTLFIDRSKKSDLRRVTPLIEDVLRSGSNVLVFPEGTSTRGAEILPFKPSMFEAAIRANVPVAAASVTYATSKASPPAYLAICWWGKMTFVGHSYKLLGLKAIRASVSFSGTPILASDRKILSRLAQQEVESLFTPVAQPAEPRP